VLIDANKRYKIEEVYETVAKSRPRGINIIANYIFGLPRYRPLDAEHARPFARD